MVTRIATKSRRARPAPIGVFDSGVGGLSVLRELERLLPGEQFVFFADQRHVPYGEKTAAQLRRYTSGITKFLLRRRCKMIVVACNTGTVYAIDYLRQTYTVPFVGTVPAIKPAVALSKSGVIAVMSTPATAVSPALKKLIRECAPEMRVLRIGCAGLEEMVECGVVSGPAVDAYLRKQLQPILRARADVVVLGCTHYPFLKRRIAALSRIRVIDAGKAIAKRTRSLLVATGLLSVRRRGATAFFTNASSTEFSRVASLLLGRRVRSHSVKL